MSDANLVLALKELRESSETMFSIFTRGSCFRLFKVLKALYPQALPYYSDIDGHWITKIDGKFYDIGGEINASYAEHNYSLVDDPTTLESANLCKWSSAPELSIGTSYNKYANTQG